ncbi:subtilase family protein [Kribbella sp. VKM Ac-2569]|uniref:S8 family serine peptidase n=1 Tax=Kribbella sp. VKM Ac-2569 TaxID=2512220 RepID=UPI00102C9485|nr:S8 family serine peptidase [Kribbella sp. VKM Ac-2569]RZT20794.1 subtilase family protein [Kribbella sp. VKM Ac-2569]
MKLRYVLGSVMLIVPMAVVAVVSPATAASPPDPAAAPAAQGHAAAKVPSMLRDAATLAAKKQASVQARSLGVEGSRLGIQVYAAAPVTAQQQAELTALGASVLKNSADFPAVAGAALPSTGLVSATVPYDKLDAVAALGWVSALRPSVRPAVDVGPITAEGVQLHQADKAQAKGLTGRGQKIGVISGDADHVADAIAAGELPADTQVLQSAAYGNDEGTAMMEIIHDLAPGAKLAFASTLDTNADYFEAFHVLAKSGVTMIAEDIALDDEPAFQQGLGAATAEALAKHGIWVSSSAGNLGNRHAPRVTATGTGKGADGATGPYTGCPKSPDNVVQLRGSDTTYDLNLLPGAGILPTLQWSEPRAIYPTAGQGGFTDLNLYLMDSTGTKCLASSTAVQANGVGDTIEQFEYFNTTTAAQPVKLVVDVEGTSTARKAPILDLRWRALAAGVQTIDPPEAAGSMNPDSNYTVFATSSGAVNSSVSTDPTTSPLEAFSAAGPTQLVSTTRCPGGRPGPCRGISGAGALNFPAPNWLAADGESVSGVGGFGSGTCPTTTQGGCRFFGTSASAPTAAGVAALTRQEFGGRVSPLVLNTILSGRAVPRTGPGTGAGVLSAR